MKPTLMPKMTGVQLRDRDGVSVTVDVKVFAHGGKVVVVMADRSTATSSLIARNAATYIVQLVERLQLHPGATQFFRHVYFPQQGSLFGRFDVVWQEQQLISYSFVMLNNLDDGKRLQEWLVTAALVPITYAQARHAIINTH
jgi:hypothetical protein